MSRSKLKRSGKEEEVIEFKEIILQSLFNRMSADLKINCDLDENDELLALCGLVQPEIRRVMQKALEDWRKIIWTPSKEASDGGVPKCDREAHKRRCIACEEIALSTLLDLTFFSLIYT